MECIHNEVERWLQKVVIGLNLCPFARLPMQSGTVKIVICDALKPLGVLTELQQQMELLQSSANTVLETTLVVTPHIFHAFTDYNNFLDEVDYFIERLQWQGIFQVASFHPQYRFAGTADDDSANLTNRAPYPIFHILREDSLSAALEHCPDTETIVEKNIQTVRNLSEVNKKALFPYIFGRE